MTRYRYGYYEEESTAWKVGKFLGAIALVGVMLRGCAGCFGYNGHYKYEDYKTHPVTQVFRDHDGYRALFIDKNKVVQEIKYPELYSFLNGRPEDIPGDVRKDFSCLNSDKQTIVIKDLPEGAEGFARVLNYSYSDGFLTSFDRVFTEVHLAENQKLGAGNEAWQSGKITKHAPMVEVE